MESQSVGSSTPMGHRPVTHASRPGFRRGRHFRRMWALLAAVAVGAGALIAGAALSSASPSPVTYFACLKGGTLSSVGTSAPASCPKGATVIQWNQTGPPGTNGNTVLNGSGPPGGTQGASGDFYIDTTANKIYGPKGGTGWPASGTSLVGPPGTNGTSITSASLDVNDPNCAEGGSSFTGVSGTTFACNGAPGTNGNTVLNGTGAPTNTTGNNGDFYIDTAADVLYGPKAGGAWPATGTNLVGQQGPPGPALGDYLYAYHLGNQTQTTTGSLIVDFPTIGINDGWTTTDGGETWVAPATGVYQISFGANLDADGQVDMELFINGGPRAETAATASQAQPYLESVGRTVIVALNVGDSIQFKTTDFTAIAGATTNDPTLAINRIA